MPTTPANQSDFLNLDDLESDCSTTSIEKGGLVEVLGHGSWDKGCCKETADAGMLQSLVGSKYIRKFDAFSKISPDAQIRTSSGGLITVLSFALITVLVFAEFISYRTVIVQPELVVDKTRAERMNIHLNISFPRVPCSCKGLSFFINLSLARLTR